MDDLIREGGHALVVPRVGSNVSAIIIDLKAILKAEARIIEVQAVTPVKAGELLAAFNVSWRDLHQNICLLEKEKNDAQRELNRIRATVILERAPKIIKEKGLSDNKETREACVTLDSEYQTTEEVLDQLVAAIELLKGKLKSFEMAYTSVKKLLGESAYNFLNRNDHDTSGDSGDREPGVVDEYERPVSGFGKPKY